MTTAINDPKGEAGSKKAPMWLLPPVALEQTAWVHKLGNDKYGPFNWRATGVCATTYVSAIMRHLNAWRDGEDLDPESGISHIAHIATSCNILLDAAACGTLQDDRNKRPEGVSREEAFQKLVGAAPSRLTEIFEEEARRMMPRAIDDALHGGRAWVDLADRRPYDHDRSSQIATVEPLPDSLEAYLDAAGRELLRTESEDSPYADQLRRVFAAEPTTGIDATPGCMTTVGLEDVRPGRCPWIGLIDKTSDFSGVVDVPRPGQIEVGGKLVDLPPVPDGYSRWVDRGEGWDSRNKRVPCFAARFDPSPEMPWQVYHNDTANGVQCSRYLEAVKDTAVRVVDHDIKPGDKVTGRLVHGEDFCGTIANIVDIRGTKLFQFLDRASISEDDIYSITHA